MIRFLDECHSPHYFGASAQIWVWSQQIFPDAGTRHIYCGINQKFIAGFAFTIKRNSIGNRAIIKLTQ